MVFTQTLTRGAFWVPFPPRSGKPLLKVNPRTLSLWTRTSVISGVRNKVVAKKRVKIGPLKC